MRRMPQLSEPASAGEDLRGETFTATAVGVFYVFCKTCTLLAPLSSRFLPPEKALWAFLSLFLSFVPLFYKKQGYRTLKNSKKRPKGLSDRSDSMENGAFRGTSFSKSPENAHPRLSDQRPESAQLPQHTSLLAAAASLSLAAGRPAPAAHKFSVTYPARTFCPSRGSCPRR